MKLLFLDTETTGVKEDSGVIQISGIIEIDGKIVEEFDFRLRPMKGDMFYPESIKAHGYSYEKIKQFPDPEPVFIELKKILEKYVDRYNKNDKFHLVGQNVGFDFDVLDRFFKKNGEKYLFSFIHYHKIDLVACTAIMKLAGKLPFLENMQLETVCKFLGINANFHDSKEDIHATRKVFYRYIESLSKIEILKGIEVESD